MYSTKEEYGSFVITGFTNIMTVTICNEASLEDYVKMAIKPLYFGGATFDTNEIPIGLSSSSPNVSTK